MGNHIKKKAQTPGDAILAVIILITLAIAGLVTTYWVNELVDSTKEIPELNTTATQAAFQAAKDVNLMWDWLILFVFLGLGFGMIIIGYFIDVQSVLFPLYIIGLLVGVILTGVISYTWDQFSDFSLFITIKASHFQITNHLISNIAIYFTILGAMSLVATYAKTRGDQ